MKRATQAFLVVGVLAVVATVIVLQATPGSVLTERTANGSPTHREYVVAFVGVLLLGLMALGMDFRDWF